jgi:hypothetical protein
MVTTFSEADIIEAFAGAMAAAPGAAGPRAMTVQEMTEVIPHSEDWIRARLRRLIASGAWECVHERRIRMDGVQQLVACYRPRPAAGKVTDGDCEVGDDSAADGNGGASGGAGAL